VDVTGASRTIARADHLTHIVGSEAKPALDVNVVVVVLLSRSIRRRKNVPRRPRFRGRKRRELLFLVSLNILAGRRKRRRRTNHRSSSSPLAHLDERAAGKKHREPNVAGIDEEHVDVFMKIPLGRWSR